MSSELLKKVKNGVEANSIIKGMFGWIKQHKQSLLIILMVTVALFYLSGIWVYSIILGKAVLLYLLAPQNISLNANNSGLVLVSSAIFFATIYIIARIGEKLKRGYFWYLVYLCFLLAMVSTTYNVLVPSLYSKEYVSTTFYHEYISKSHNFIVLDVLCYPGDGMIYFVEGHRPDCTIGAKSKSSLDHYEVFFLVYQDKDTHKTTYIFDKSNSTREYNLTDVQFINPDPGIANVSIGINFVPKYGGSGEFEYMETPKEILFLSEREYINKIFKEQVAWVLGLVVFSVVGLASAISSIKNLLQP